MLCSATVYYRTVMNIFKHSLLGKPIEHMFYLGQVLYILLLYHISSELPFIIPVFSLLYCARFRLKNGSGIISTDKVVKKQAFL